VWLKATSYQPSAISYQKKECRWCLKASDGSNRRTPGHLTFAHLHIS